MFILSKTGANTYTAHKVDGMSEEALKIVRLHAEAGIDTHIVKDIEGAKDFLAKGNIEVIHSERFNVSFEVGFSAFRTDIEKQLSRKKLPFTPTESTMRKIYYSAGYEAGSGAASRLGKLYSASFLKEELSKLHIAAVNTSIAIKKALWLKPKK